LPPAWSAATTRWIGDLIAKLRSPEMTVSTIFSRPGAIDTADGTSSSFGSSANWSNSEILFAGDANGPSAEQMGSGLGDNQSICIDDGNCEYRPAPGSGPGTSLASDFDGETYVGTWTLCMGDAIGPDAGSWNNGIIDIELERHIPCACSGKFKGGDRVKWIGPNNTGDPTIGTEGEVMCGNNSSGILASWDGFVTGHLGNSSCQCPTTQDMGTTYTGSGWFAFCNQLELIMPFTDDFESNSTIRWSVVHL